MRVYHGAANYSLPALQACDLELRPRQYLGGRRAFCTTTDFDIAVLFALRRSPPSLLRGDESEAGVVVAYTISVGAIEGKDWVHAVCGGVLQDEKEIAILNPKVLRFLSTFRLNRSNWIQSLVH